MNYYLFMVISFIIGSVPVGLLIANAKGVDIRKVGSGNIGATNILRSVGKKEALATLLGDMAKGLIPVLIARELYPDSLKVGLVGIAAIVGHDFSIFLKLKGGKGVATSLGVILAYSPLVALITIVVWISVFIISRISSLSALIAFILLPANTYLIDNAEGKFLISLMVCLLIIVKHKDNIMRLLRGEESRVGQNA
ncbi:MAG: glycerol-3-phosphate 1-O-acyltransferase PlsY [Nitrospirota bacterium]|nr:MAG: glycerol-3-phosphate 1-O-acyltransferase PlsY [Nitrospirota bacterium]